MKTVYTIAEILLGITFIFGGVNGLMIPLGYGAIIPANPQSELATVMTETYYILILQKTVELIFGVCLLLRKFRFVSLLALTPIVISILVYHIFDDREGLMIGMSVFALYLIAVTGQREQIKTLLKMD